MECVFEEIRYVTGVSNEFACSIRDIGGGVGGGGGAVVCWERMRGGRGGEGGLDN